MTAIRIQRCIDAVWRMESPRLIAGLMRMVGEIGAAEDLAQDALVSALEHWPASGVPDNPGAWLMATAKHRAIDRLRRDDLLRRKHDELGHHIELLGDMAPGPEQSADEDIGDDLLRLMFTACHPLLPSEARVALTLRLLGGLSTDEIAKAFLLPEATIAQRIVRAKKTLAKAKLKFEVPRKHELATRLGSVLDVVYLIFNEGYSASSGVEWMRPLLCEEALRLGRVLAGLAPGEPEVHGLLALMEIQASRTAARCGSDGEPVLLLEQNRARWDRLQIRRGLLALQRAQDLGGARGVYALQGAIAACHARALTAETTDWLRIASLYDELLEVAGSPVVELNRAVALGMAHGPAAGLAAVDRLRDEPALRDYHLLPAVRGDLLHKLRQFDAAQAEFARAAQMTRNQRERTQLLARSVACTGG